MSKEPIGILGGSIYYLKGNYQQVADTVGFDTENRRKKFVNSQKGYDAQIEKDMLRTTFFVEDKDEFAAIQNQWRSARFETLEVYDQADPHGSPILNHMWMTWWAQLSNELCPPYPQGKQTPAEFTEYVRRSEEGNQAIQKFKEMQKVISFGYLNNQNKASGVFILFSTDKDNPYWAISIVENPIASPKDRIVHVFTYFPKGVSENTFDKKKLSALRPTKVSTQITSKKYFPHRVLPFQQTLKETLNSEKVYSLLENMLNPNNTMKLDFFDKANLERRGYKIEGNMTTPPPVGMFDGDIYYVEGNYHSIADALNFPPNEDDSSNLGGRIIGDIERAAYLEDPLPIIRHWKAEIKKGVPTGYAQGDLNGSPLPLLVANKVRVLYQQNVAKKTGIVPDCDVYQLSYVNDNGKVSGLHFARFKLENDEFWMLSILEHSYEDPSNLKLRVFFHFPKKGSPDFTHPLYDEKKLAAFSPKKILPNATRGTIPHHQLLIDVEQSINSKSAFEFVRKIINPNGTINPDFEKQLEGQNTQQEIDVDQLFTTEEKVGTGFVEENKVKVVKPLLEKKPEDTVTLSATPINAKPNANVTAFIQAPKIASAINKNIASRNFALSNDRHFLVNQNDGREIHIGLQGQMTTDPIDTAKTPNATQVTLDILISMLRTNSIIFCQGGEDNFPAEKMALQLTQKAGATEIQKANFLRMEEVIRKALLFEIEDKDNATQYPDVFLNKMSFNGISLANLKKRKADAISSEPKGKEELDEPEKTSDPKRLKR